MANLDHTSNGCTAGTADSDFVTANNATGGLINEVQGGNNNILMMNCSGVAVLDGAGSSTVQNFGGFSNMVALGGGNDTVVDFGVGTNIVHTDDTSGYKTVISSNLASMSVILNANAEYSTRTETNGVVVEITNPVSGMSTTYNFVNTNGQTPLIIGGRQNFVTYPVILEPDFGGECDVLEPTSDNICDDYEVDVLTIETLDVLEPTSDNICDDYEVDVLTIETLDSLVFVTQPIIPAPEYAHEVSVVEPVF